jgi:DNA repair protein RecN (Recombination protein N)
MLIAELDISFEKGLNIITGETGAGKTAILTAIAFTLGQKADSSLIRSGEQRASCELIFDEVPREFHSCEYGLEIDPSDALIIRREINSEGRSKSFINNQAVTLSVLKKLAGHLMEFSNQKESLVFSDDVKILSSLDQFGELEKEVTRFRQAWQEYGALRSKIETLGAQKASRTVSNEQDRAACEEIKAAALVAGEEEALLQEYEILANQEELEAATHDVCGFFDDENRGPLPSLAAHCTRLAKASKIDPSLGDIEKHLRAILAELGEARHDLLRYLSKLERDPARLERVSERLNTIATLRKKYGGNIQDVIRYREELEKKLNVSQETDFLLEELEEKLESTKVEVDSAAGQLSQKRKTTAEEFGRRVTGSLRSLNMARAIFEVELQAQPRSSHGDEMAKLFLSPNLGEKRLPVADSASGGEMARLLLAFHLTFSAKLGGATLFFDEIDANIGGETAALIGQKLALLGRHTQVIAITHFPQVALSAAHHIILYKKERNGRTCSCAKILSTEDEHKLELLRMVGGNKLIAEHLSPA